MHGGGDNFPETVAYSTSGAKLIHAIVGDDHNITVEYNYAFNSTDWIGIFTGHDPKYGVFYLWSHVGESHSGIDDVGNGNGFLTLNDTHVNSPDIEFPLSTGAYKVGFFIDDSYYLYGNLLDLVIFNPTGSIPGSISVSPGRNVYGSGDDNDDEVLP